MIGNLFALLNHQGIKSFRIGLILIVLISIIISTGTTSAQIGLSSGSTHTLRVNVGNFPATLDPQLISFSNELNHARLIFEGLTRLDDSLKPSPGAAESWSFDQSGMELTLTLRNGLTYSDGSVLNAKRFEFAILRAMDPRTAAQYGNLLDDIVGANAFRSANPSTSTPEQLAALRAAVGVHALDSSDNPCTSYTQMDCRKFRINFIAPVPYFLNVLSLWIVAPVKEENIVNGGSDWWKQSSLYVGNGPFVLTNFNTSSFSTFTPNFHYWRGVASYNMTFSYINDSAVALLAYKNNQVDIISPGAYESAEIKNNPTLKSQLHSYPASCTYAVMFNDKEPFTDKKVREAFIRSIDQQAWVDEILGGMGTPAKTWIPAGEPGYDPLAVQKSYNPTAAVQTLQESSYGGVTGLPTIKATFSDSPRSRTRFQWLADHWKSNLGVEIIQDPVDAITYANLTKDKSTAPQFYILGWCEDYPDPQNWLSLYWHTGGFGSKIYYSNPTVDTLLDLADTTIDPILRLERYQQAQRLIIDDEKFLALWHNSNVFLIKPNTTGYKFTNQDITFPGWVDPLSIYFPHSIFIPNVKK
jgi:oligopeptide transport system substrate-binding protein